MNKMYCLSSQYHDSNIYKTVAENITKSLNFKTISF